MDAIQKLQHAAQGGLWESEGEPPALRASSGCGGAAKSRESWIDVGGASIPVTLAAAGGGRAVRLLKAMLTTACERDCLYCSFRAGRDCRRQSFGPEEMARLFDQIHRAGLVDGLFLSTGILKGGANTQNKLLDTAEILRRRLGYRGYLHLKIMPGAEKGQVRRAMELANRVSVNLEAPNASRLERLAPHKGFQEELVTPLRWAKEIRREMLEGSDRSPRAASTATQFVVGAADETDLELLSTSEKVLRDYGLTRVYYMAFNPVPGTPLENHPPEDPTREHRLYQASYLIRDYGFDLEDLPFTGEGRLPLERDPKQAYAEANLRHRPVEVTLAGREELLRVPGIGPRGAERILRARTDGGGPRDLQDLRRLGILAERAAPYITLRGKAAARQLRLL